ncbi:tyrosinase [Xylaria bambusicola]|uniref:tyrosinase n=1 Tax=Xylaria bambusicola TaxID=326684 RepID=UPI002007D176|nr:tyrosinase [Xylaria bambusicola]KAI0509078.1 tyrosinase [Xylaria bambusicola]
MSYKYYPITGIKDGLGPHGKVPVRRDFDEWSTSTDETDKIQFILYLLALKRLQAVDPADRDSYFQIAGIHGYPYQPWDEPSTTQAEIGRKGYCNHANVLFPSWHRPYMLLYEQRLYEIMVNEIIPKYPAYKEKYLAAAHKWRLPFWDWAKNPRVPRLARYKTVSIAFGGEPKFEIANPLYQFRMPNDKKMRVYGVGSIVDFDGGEPFDYGECIATSRCPTKDDRKSDSNAWINGAVHDDEVDRFLTEHSSVTDESYGTAAELVYRLLTYPMDYSHFATLARDETAKSAGASTSKVTNDINLEFVHNNIHYWVGGNGGHMSQIPVATFDPTFWLHHCNIDRLFALWQTINPGKWFTSDTQRFFDQKIVGSGSLITNKTPLRPFHKDTSGTYWTPDDTLDWFKLGYTYPELPTGKETPAQILKIVNEDYGITRKEALMLAQSASDPLPGFEVLSDGARMYDYALSIKYSKFALGGRPFNIEVFLRPEGETKNTFKTEDFVTNVFNFSQRPEDEDGNEVCDNCKKGHDKNVQSTAYVPLTSYLLKMFKQQQLNSLEPPTVEKVLKRMYWRIVDIGGQTIPEEKWKDTMNLDLSVSKTQMSYSSDPQKPTKFPNPEVIPQLGTDLAEPQAQTGTGNIITVSKINKLSEPVLEGGSIVFKSPSMKLAKPARETGTGIALLNWDPASKADSLDTENYDILLSMVIKNGKRVVQCNHKLAGKGYNVIKEFSPSPWFSESPELKVDIKGDQFDIYVDGRKVESYKREIKKSVTHVHYYSTPSRAEPVMAREITANTY